MNAPMFPIQARDGTVSVAVRKALDLSTAFVVLEVAAPRNCVTMTLDQAMQLRKALDARIDHVATMIALKDQLGRSAA